MPVTAQTPYSNYVGNGATTVFAFTFLALLSGDLVVKVGGVTKTLGVDYTIAGLGVAAGGNVTMTAAPANLATVSIYRNTALTRTTDYQTNGDFLADTVDADFDRLWMALQDAVSGATGYNRAVKAPAGEVLADMPSAAARAGNVLTFDSNGNPIVAAAVAGTATQLTIDLASTALATKNAGQIGLNTALAYPTGTVGAALQATPVVGNGVTDNSAALLAAVAIGKPIVFSGISVIGTPTTITVPIVDTMAQIFSTASQVTINNNQPVRPEWWGIGNQNVVDLAINSLPAAGGVVQLEDRTYLTSNYAYGFGGTGKNISKQNVKIQGRKMPTLASDCKSLTGGTILQGMVTAFADNIEFSDLGVDVGFTFTANFLGGASVAGFCDALILSYGNDAVKASAALRNRAVLRNVIGLCCAPTSPSHAILIEGYKNVSLQGDVIGCYGVHGCAIKSLGVRADSIATYCNGTDGLIIKSDSQATAIAGDIQIGKVYCNASGPPGLSPYLASTTGTGLLAEAAGNNIGRVQIGSVDSFGYPTGAGGIFGGSFTIDNFEIAQLTTDQIGVGAPVAALNLTSAANQNFARWHIGSALFRNCGLAANFNFTQAANNPNHVSIGQLEVITATDVAVQMAGSSWVDIGALVAVSCTAGVYRMLGTTRLQVGMLTQAGTTPASTYTSSSGGLQPALANSWTQYAANDPFAVDLTGGRVNLRGLVIPGTTNVISTLPLWARPTTNKRFMVQGSNGTVAAVPLVVDTAGNVKVNEVAGGFANCTTWLSLSGVTYDQQA